MKKYFDYFDGWEKFIKFDENYRESIYDSDEKLMKLGFEFFEFAGIDVEMLERFEKSYKEIDAEYKDDARRYSVEMYDLYDRDGEYVLDDHIQEWYDYISDKNDYELLEEAGKFTHWIDKELKEGRPNELGGLYDLLYEAQRNFYESFLEEFLYKALAYMKHYRIGKN